MNTHSGPALRNETAGGFTLVELLVVIAVIALLMAILIPALTRAKEQGKRAVCLHHLRELMVAWMLYADDNNDKIVRGDTGEYDDIHPGEIPWVLQDWVSVIGPPLTMEEKKEKIMKGALFRYTRDVRVYKCPTGQSENMRMYSVVDSMNGIYHPRINVGNGANMIRFRQKIRKPHERFVFLDDGGTGDSAMGGFTVRVYKNSDQNTQRWWDPPPIRHSEGTTFSFADGHTEYYKYRDKRTIDFGRKGIAQSTVEEGQGNEDMRWCSIGIWGSPPVDRDWPQ